MSVQDLKEYGKRAAQDPAVRARAKSIGLQDVKGQAAYAKTLGFNFDEADMAALAKEVAPTGELSDKQLQQVSGGVIVTIQAAVAVSAGSSGGHSTVSIASAGGW